MLTLLYRRSVERNILIFEWEQKLHCIVPPTWNEDQARSNISANIKKNIQIRICMNRQGGKPISISLLCGTLWSNESPTPARVFLTSVYFHLSIFCHVRKTNEFLIWLSRRRNSITSLQTVEQISKVPLLNLTVH